MVQTEPEAHRQRHEPDSSFWHEHKRSRSPSAWQRKVQVTFLAVHGESDSTGCLGHLLFGPDHATAGASASASASASARAITVTARAKPVCFIAASEAQNSARVKRGCLAAPNDSDTLGACVAPNC